MKEALLEDLAQTLQCFISSLPSMMNQPNVLQSLCGLPRQRYDLAEWGYCIRYLFHEEADLPDYDALDRFLILKRQASE